MKLDMSKLALNTLGEAGGPKNKDDWYYIEDPEYAELVLATALLAGCEEVSEDGIANKLMYIKDGDKYIILWKLLKDDIHKGEIPNILQVKLSAFNKFFGG